MPMNYDSIINTLLGVVGFVFVIVCVCLYGDLSVGLILFVISKVYFTVDTINSLVGAPINWRALTRRTRVLLYESTLVIQ